jgi:hypothetical protein
MDDNSKNYIIGFLIIILLFLIYKKLMNKTKENFSMPNQSFNNLMMQNLQNSKEYSMAQSMAQPMTQSSQPMTQSSQPMTQSSQYQSEQQYTQPYESQEPPHSESYHSQPQYTQPYESQEPHHSVQHHSMEPQYSESYHSEPHHSVHHSMEPHHSVHHSMEPHHSVHHSMEHNYFNLLQPINSNVLDNNMVTTNMIDNELLYINDSKPYLLDNDKSLDNTLGCNNAIQLEDESKHFSYYKNIDGVNPIEDLNLLYQLI